MNENAAQDGRTGVGETMTVSRPLIVERRNTEIPVEGKWPRGWRILFLGLAAGALWAAVIMAARWL